MNHRSVALVILLVLALTGLVNATPGDREAMARFQQRYERLKARVQMSYIDKPSRARLDAAAYLNNPLRDDPRMGEHPPLSHRPTLSDLRLGEGWAGPMQKELPVSRLPQPLAWDPMLDLLAEWDYDATVGLLDLTSAVSSEDWGTGEQRFPLQRIVAAFLIEAGQTSSQVWAEVEFAPGVLPAALGGDADRDGVSELYALLSRQVFPERAITYLRQEYLTRTLSDIKVEDYFYELSSDWYEKYNTDTLDLEVQSPWPNESTEPEIRREVGDAVIQSPTAILKGKPFGKPIYNVFVVRSAEVSAASGDEISSVATAVAVGPDDSDAVGMEANVARWRTELKRWGDGNWQTWVDRVVPFRKAVSDLLANAEPNRKGFIGKDGFLFFRGSLNYSAGGDIQSQQNNPFPAIVDYARQLEAKGIDLLFVIIPAKSEIYPDKLSDYEVSPGRPYVNPYTRKFLLELAEAGVEVVDLYPRFLEERDRGDEPLYMPLDTHWSHRGVRLAAELIAERVRRYPWYSELSGKRIQYGVRPAESVRAGDIRGMLSDAEKARFRPMQIKALQVVRPDGTLYEDDPTSPIVMLGDSFTGVFHFEDSKHAGISAHLAREIGLPVDLVMAYGSGPRIRKRFARRGAEAVAQKRLVIWTTAARDLWEYWAPWEKVLVP